MVSNNWQATQLSCTWTPVNNCMDLDRPITSTQAINTMRAFGLRSRELATLNSKSFLQDTQTGNYYVQTIGKGGKYRIAECRENLKIKMTNYYQPYLAENKVNLTHFNGNKDYLLRNIKKGLKIDFKGQLSHNIPKHIFRADYAENLLQQKFNNYQAGPIHYGYSMVKVHNHQVDLQKHIRLSNGQQAFETIQTVPLNNVQTQIGAYKGPLRAFTEVSINLGHNRLNVLLKYL